jgi:hypothetical protein
MLRNGHAITSRFLNNRLQLPTRHPGEGRDPCLELAFAYRLIEIPDQKKYCSEWWEDNHELIAPN